jgi:hypothetical protein
MIEIGQVNSQEPHRLWGKFRVMQEVFNGRKNLGEVLLILAQGSAAGHLDKIVVLDFDGHRHGSGRSTAKTLTDYLNHWYYKSRLSPCQYTHELDFPDH